MLYVVLWSLWENIKVTCMQFMKLDRSKSSVNLLYFRGGLAYDQKPREINDLTNI